MNYPELPGKIRHDICEWWKTVHQNGDQPWREALQELKAKDEFPLLKLGVDLLSGRIPLEASLASPNFVERRVAEIVRDFKGAG
jgi:hypothetical protein